MNQTTESIVYAEKAQLDFSQAMSYADYLQLDTLFDTQKPLSPEHDELLFIIQHQASELWMKLMIHELIAAIKWIISDKLNSACKGLSRINKIMTQIVSAWDVLSTMTPSEYIRFRPFLANSSGFQSHQYRCIEFAMGNKNPAMLKPHEHHPKRMEIVKSIYESPSIYDESLKLLNRRGLLIPETHTQRDWTQPYTAHQAVEEAWHMVYSDPDQYWDLYQLAEKLVDIEDIFRMWRFRHVTTVERVIGFKRGTGGTSGVAYLRKMLDVVLFPELWTLRTSL